MILSRIAFGARPWHGELAAGKSARARFSREISRWLSFNYWSPEHLALLTEKCCPGWMTLSSQEISSMLSGAMPELMSKHFIAMAMVDQFCRSMRPQVSMSDGDLIACFYMPICVDRSSVNASWWFGTYCGEEWALQGIRQDFDRPIRDFDEIRISLPPVFRKFVVDSGIDPIKYVKEAAQRLPSASSLNRQRFVDWMLGSGGLDQDEGRIALAFALVLLSELGYGYESITLFDQDHLGQLSSGS